MAVKFEWDDDKAKANLKKHKVSFDEASTVFGDPFAKIFFDEEHSTEENREIIVGHSITQPVVAREFYGDAVDTGPDHQCQGRDQERTQGL